MIPKGEYLAGSVIKVSAVFHDDDNTPANPTSPGARLVKPDDSGVNLTTPAIIASKVGWYGTQWSIPSGADEGTYRIKLTGTVSGHAVDMSFEFQVVSVLRVVTPDTIRYTGSYHDDANTPANPSDTNAILLYPDGTTDDAIDVPVKIDSKTGWFGGDVDASSLVAGDYAVYQEGTVSAHVVASVYHFQVRNYVAPTIPGAPDIILNRIVSNTSVKVELQRVTGTKMKVGYRQFKHQGVDEFTLTNFINAPSNGDLVTLSGLPEDVEIEILAWSYQANADGEAIQSGPSNRIRVLPSASGRTIKKILQAIETFLQNDLNAEIVQQNTEHGTSWDPIPNDNYFLGEFPAKWEYPQITIISSGTADIRRAGDRREWTYDATILVADKPRAESPESLEDRLKDYLRAIENVMFENQTLGGIVYKMEVTTLGLDPTETTGQEPRDAAVLLEIEVTNG